MGIIQQLSFPRKYKDIYMYDAENISVYVNNLWEFKEGLKDCYGRDSIMTAEQAKENCIIEKEKINTCCELDDYKHMLQLNGFDLEEKS